MYTTAQLLGEFSFGFVCLILIGGGDFYLMSQSPDKCVMPQSLFRRCQSAGSSQTISKWLPTLLGIWTRCPLHCQILVRKNFCCHSEHPSHSLPPLWLTVPLPSFSFHSVSPVQHISGCSVLRSIIAFLSLVSVWYWEGKTTIDITRGSGERDRCSLQSLITIFYKCTLHRYICIQYIYRQTEISLTF